MTATAPPGAGTAEVPGLSKPRRSRFARRLTSARLGVRLARRELRRRPWRTVLVLLMVLLPTAVMASLVTLLRTSEWSAADQAAAESGQADAEATFEGGQPGRPPPVEGPMAPEVANAGPSDEQLDELRAGLPAGSSVLVEHKLEDRVTSGDRRVYVQVSDLALDDRMTDGRFGARQGRLPTAAGEAVISTTAADRLGVEIGETFTADRLGTRLTVVGTVVVRSDNANLVYVPTRIQPGNGVSTKVLVDLPVRPSDPGGASSPLDGGHRVALTANGWSLFVFDDAGAEPKTAAVFWSYVGGGVGLIVLGTVITAAFAVGARRQLRSVGLLSATGASPPTVKWFLVAQGVVAGAVGSVIGVAAGVAAVRLLPQAVLDSMVGRPVEGLTTRPVDLVPIVVIGTAVAAVAAWLPARSASRAPTLAALAGRRPLPRVPRRLPVLGALSIGAGCALLAIAVAGSRGGGSSLWALVAVVGGVAVLLGAIAIAPWVIAGVEPASTRMPESGRLAGRSLARSRVRSSAVVGAVCAVSASVIAGATLYQSLGGRSTASAPQVRDDQVVVSTNAFPGQGVTSAGQPAPTSVLRRISAILPGARPHRVPELVASEAVDATGAATAEAELVPERAEERDEDPYLSRDEDPYLSVAQATPELLDLLAVPSRLRAEIDDGAAISVTPPPFASRSVRIEAVDPLVGPADPTAPSGSLVRLAGWFDSPAASAYLPEVLISRATAERLGLASRPGPRTLLDLPVPVSDRQRTQLSLLSQDLVWEQYTEGRRFETGAGVGVLVELATPPEKQAISPAMIKAGALGVSLVLVLAVVAVGLALAAKDSEDERQVLTAVGAPPRTLRRVGALRAALLVLIAGLISIPAGLLPSAAIVAASETTGSIAFRPDLWSVLFVAVLAPAVAGLVTWSGGRLRDLLRPTRPSVFAFGE